MLLSSDAFVDGVMAAIAVVAAPTPTRTFLAAIKAGKARDAVGALWVAWHLGTVRSWPIAPRVRARSFALVLAVASVLATGSLAAAAAVRVVAPQMERAPVTDPGGPRGDENGPVTDQPTITGEPREPDAATDVQEPGDELDDTDSRDGAASGGDDPDGNETTIGGESDDADADEDSDGDESEDGGESDDADEDDGSDGDGSEDVDQPDDADEDEGSDGGESDESGDDEADDPDGDESDGPDHDEGSGG